jgi:hypothetical protein
MNIALACKNRLALKHLTKDTARAPHIDGRRVFSQLEEQLWWPIPTRDN